MLVATNQTKQISNPQEYSVYQQSCTFLSDFFKFIDLLRIIADK